MGRLENWRWQDFENWGNMVLLGCMKKLYGICHGSPTVVRSANDQSMHTLLLKFRGPCIHWAASDRVAGMVRYFQLPSFKDLSILCPKPDSVKYCLGQFSTLSTHLCVWEWRTSWLVLGKWWSSSWFCWQTSRRQNQNPVYTVSSQHQLSGKVQGSHLTPSYKVQHIQKSSSSVQNQRGSVLANILDDKLQLFL